jgi:hypothetical protein
MSSYRYTQYLSSKTTVDDRAINKDVFERVRRELRARGAQECAITELGGGVGTMVARLIGWNLVDRARYRLLDVDDRLLADARSWLTAWASARSLAAEQQEAALRIHSPAGLDWRIEFVKQELSDEAQPAPAATADLLIANAFLDLVDLGTVLPALFRRHLSAGGLYWFTVNFDGETIFEPTHRFDEALLAVYHRSMDQRICYGRPAGDSKTGRRLFSRLREAGATILEAGSSDWVIFADEGGHYRAAEADFVRHILDTVSEELQRHADVDRDALAEWTAARAAQLAEGRLVYIAHQIDYCGRFDR